MNLIVYITSAHHSYLGVISYIDNLNMSQVQDILTVFKGLQKVIEAGFKLQTAQTKNVWGNLTIKTLPSDIFASGQKIYCSEISQNNAGISDSFERVFVVMAGLNKYLSLQIPSDANSASKILKKAEIDELNSRFESIFDISNFEKYMTDNRRSSEKCRGYENFKHNSVKTTRSEIGCLPLQHLNESVSTKTDLNNINDTFKSKSTNNNFTNYVNVVASPDNKIPPQVLSSIVENISSKPESQLQDLHITSAMENISLKTEPISIDPVIKAQTVKAKPRVRQTLSEISKQRAVPSSRISRLFAFGSLAAGLGIGTATEYAKNVITGASKNDESLSGLFLSTSNAERIVNTLCKVRGAALKLGQLLSLQDETVMSPELQKIFERVRQSADFMPKFQVDKMLSDELGPNWRDKFASFEDKPFAAASIGQVHLATLHDGTEVAVKIQYPGVAKGINSDIDNLVSVLKVWDIFPKGLFIDNIVEVAKKELAWEVDYVREAACTRKFRELLLPFPQYYVPKVVDELCTHQVLTTELIEGQPLDKCFSMDYEIREDIAYKVMNLCLHEMFVFRCMQTDPNWSNFFYNTSTKKLILLDFGATREYSKAFMDSYIRIIKAASDGNSNKVLKLSKEMKFLTGYESKKMEEAHVETVMVMAEIFTPKSGKKFDFAAQNTTKRIHRLVPTILSHRLCPPPEEIYSLHRKLSGVFLLCSKLRVQMDCRDMFHNIYDAYDFNKDIDFKSTV